MGGIGTCCCGECCLEEEEIPFETVQLITPYENCENSQEDPVYPSFNIGFENSPCCFGDSFTLFCQEPSAACSLYAKRTINWGFDAKYYKCENDYIVDPEGTATAEDCDCSCVLWQTKSVSATRTARVFYGRSYVATSIKITIGKVFIQCDGDSEKVCKYYIAATYSYDVSEGTSLIQQFYDYDFTCTGNYQNGNCSITQSWSETGGTNSDSCSGIEIFYLPTKTVEITRAKFYDVLPTGTVTITNTDLPPFGCCDGKTNCLVKSPSCGLDFSATGCFSAMPAYPEDADSNLASYCDMAGSGTGGPLYWSEDTNQLECYVIETNGFFEPSENPYRCTGSCYVKPYEASCFLDEGWLCNEDGVGVDRFVEVVGGTQGFEGGDMCGTLDAWYPQPEEDPQVALPDCIHGSPLPTPGLCVIPSCCVITGEPPFEIESTCSYLANLCGRKLENLTCSTTRTDYPVGEFCLPFPTVTLELT